MFNSFKIIILILFFSTQNLYASDFYKALQDAYLSNPELNAERENISVSEEDLKISKIIQKDLHDQEIFIMEENCKKILNEYSLDDYFKDYNTILNKIEERIMFSRFVL